MIKNILGGFVGGPWFYIAIAGSSFLAGWWVNGWRHDSQQVETVKEEARAQIDTYKRRDAAAVDQAARDQTLATASAAAGAAITTNRDAIQAAVQGQKFTEEYSEEFKDASGNTNDRRSVRRNPAYRLCFNAAVSANPTEIAACEAAGGHAGLQGEQLPPSGMVR